MAKKDTKFVPRGGNWAGHKRRNGRVTLVHETQGQAIICVWDIATALQTETFIHWRNGRICERKT